MLFTRAIEVTEARRVDGGGGVQSCMSSHSDPNCTVVLCAAVVFWGRGRSDTDRLSGK